MAREDLAPAFSVSVNDLLVGEDVTIFVTQVSVEYADGIAHMAEVKLSDARFRESGQLALIPSKLFAWGNEVLVKFGYGPNLTTMGRFIIARVEASFPEGDAPGLTVKAYSADFLMMSNGPDGAKRGKALGAVSQGVHVTGSKKPKASIVTVISPNDLHLNFPTNASKRSAKQQHSRQFSDVLYEEAVAQVAAAYGFRTEIDPTGLPPQTFQQVPAVTDFALVRGIANIVGFLFWVDGDENGHTLHFRNPARIYDESESGASPVQQSKYTFIYGPASGVINTSGFVSPDQSGSLISFQPEGAIVQERTKLRVVYHDPIDGSVKTEEIDENGFAGDPSYSGNPEETVTKAPESGGAIRLFFDDFSVETIADRQFANGLELKQWAAQWFQRNRENFQLGRGKVIGIEDLRAFQIHSLQGIGPWSGDWYLARVKHVIDNESGYTIDFHARKVVRP